MMTIKQSRACQCTLSLEVILKLIINMSCSLKTNIVVFFLGWWWVRLKKYDQYNLSNSSLAFPYILGFLHSCLYCKEIKYLFIYVYWFLLPACHLSLQARWYMRQSTGLWYSLVKPGCLNPYSHICMGHPCVLCMVPGMHPLCMILVPSTPTLTIYILLGSTSIRNWCCT